MRNSSIRVQSLWGCLLTDLLILFAFPSVLLAQEGAEKREKILLQILDADELSPLPNVLAFSTDGMVKGTSDPKGGMALPSSLDQNEVITFRLFGYHTVEKRVGELLALPMPRTLHLHLANTLLEAVSVEQKVVKLPKTSVGKILTAKELSHTIGEGLGEVLEGIKGVSLIRTGTTNSTPVIHGMSGHRILVVNNGVRYEGQNWNPEFSPLVSTSNAGTITLIKGAESVKYGGDALGGVIVLDAAPLPYRKGFSGFTHTQYSTNGHSYGGMVMLESGVLSQKEVAFRLQSFYSNGGDRSTAHYLLNNTGTREWNVEGTLGVQRPNWGAEVSYTYSAHRSGTFIGAKMGSRDMLKERIAIGQPLPDNITPYTRDIAFPLHEGNHQYVKGKLYWQTDKFGRWEAQMALQRDVQKEFHVRRMERSHIPSTSLTLKNLQGEVKWQHHYLRHWRTETALQSTYINNYNQKGTGVVPLIPNYVQLTAGGYAVQKYSLERWGAEVGMRFDKTFLNASGYNYYSQHYGGIRGYDNLSYNLGAYYHVTPALHLTTHIGRAWRPPHVAELWSNGVDATGGLYLVGDSTMVTEKSTKWITALTYESRKAHLKVSLEGYFQWVEGYLYKEPTQEDFTVVSGTYPLFQYRQTNATLHGVDAELEWIPFRWVQYRVMSGMIWATEEKRGGYLPYIPPLRVTQELSFQFPLFEATKMSLEHSFVDKQRRFDPRTDLTSEVPPAYHLLHLKASTTLPLGQRQKLQCSLSVHNLLNKEYKEYTNLARYYAHDLGRDIMLSLRYIF